MKIEEMIAEQRLRLEIVDPQYSALAVPVGVLKRFIDIAEAAEGLRDVLEGLTYQGDSNKGSRWLGEQVLEDDWLKALAAYDRAKSEVEE